MSDATIQPRRRLRLRTLDHVIISMLTLGLAGLLLWPTIFLTVGAGQVGVLFRLLGDGTETRYVYHEGVAVMWPWDGIVLYDVRTQARTFTARALAANGMVVMIDVTVLYNPIPDETGLLHKKVGPHYPEIIVVPKAIEALRQVIGQYDEHTIYTSDTYEMADAVLTELQNTTVGSHITYSDMIISRIALPDTVDDAINEKLTQEQYAQAYVFRVQQAMREAERKRVEAIGIQTFYSIVADALSPQLLTWRGIEATVEIAHSPNTKIVIVGSSEDQLPLILGSDITSQPSLPIPSMVDPESHQLPDLEALPRLFSSEAESEMLAPFAVDPSQNDDDTSMPSNN